MPPPLIVVIGVSGSGKSVVGAALAQRLRLSFADADDFHSAANVAKMTAGEPLDDHDRYPWLDSVGAWLSEHLRGGGVMSCSALRREYRDRLRRHAPDARFVLLQGTPELLASRVVGRTGHFMPPSLLRSQLATLEPLASDEIGITIEVDQTVEEIVACYLSAGADS